MKFSKSSLNANLGLRQHLCRSSARFSVCERWPASALLESARQSTVAMQNLNRILDISDAMSKVRYWNSDMIIDMDPVAAERSQTSLPR